MAFQRLTIFLLRDVGDLDSALAEDVVKGLDVSELKQASGLNGRFYSKKSFPRTPSWAKYVEPVIDGGVHGVQSASSSACCSSRSTATRSL